MAVQWQRESVRLKALGQLLSVHLLTLSPSGAAAAYPHSVLLVLKCFHTWTWRQRRSIFYEAEIVFDWIWPLTQGLHVQYMYMLFETPITKMMVRLVEVGKKMFHTWCFSVLFGLNILQLAIWKAIKCFACLLQSFLLQAGRQKKQCGYSENQDVFFGRFYILKLINFSFSM